MSHILILTHGNFGEALIHSAEMISGPMDNVSFYGLQPGVNPQDFIAEVNSKIQDKSVKYFILVDLFGGTPFHAAMYLTKTLNAEVITGASLPLLLELHSQVIYSDTIDINAIIEMGQDAIKHAKLKKGKE